MILGLRVMVQLCFYPDIFGLLYSRQAHIFFHYQSTEFDYVLL